jgi:hypothetical protein
MAKGGRPTKLTPELITKFSKALTRSWYVSVACNLVGLSHQTVHNWIKKGKRDRTGIHGQFVEAIKKALAEAEAGAVTIIQLAARDHWQAAAWMLERRHPGRWASMRGEIRELQRWVKEREERERKCDEGTRPSPPA